MTGVVRGTVAMPRRRIVSSDCLGTQLPFQLVQLGTMPRAKCQGCGLKAAAFGLPDVGKKRRWCSDCAKGQARAVNMRKQECEGCGLKAASFGLETEGKKRRWCGDCAKGKAGAVCLTSGKKCEGCGLKAAPFGLPCEGKTRRWCSSCAKGRPGTVDAKSGKRTRTRTARAIGTSSASPGAAKDVAFLSVAPQGRYLERDGLRNALAALRWTYRKRWRLLLDLPARATQPTYQHPEVSNDCVDCGEMQFFYVFFQSRQSVVLWPTGWPYPRTIR